MLPKMKHALELGDIARAVCVGRLKAITEVYKGMMLKVNFEHG